MFKLQNADTVPHFDKEADLNSSSDPKVIAFNHSIGVGKEVTRYSVRLRYHPGWGSFESNGHVSLDYQAYYSDGTKSTWYSLSESSHTLELVKEDAFIEIPLEDLTSVEDIKRVQQSVKDCALKKWAHAHYSGFSHNCVDTARYAMRKILPGFNASSIAIPRDFTLACLKQKFDALEQASQREGKTDEELRMLDLRTLECLKATLEFMQTGYDTLYASKTSIYDDHNSQHLSRFHDGDSTRDEDYSLNLGALGKDKAKQVLDRCPKMRQELYKLHNYLVEEYIPYCKSKDYDPNKMLEILSGVNKILSSSLKSGSRVGANLFFTKQRAEFGKEVRTAVISLLFYLVRAIVSTKFERQIQRGEDLAETQDGDTDRKRSRVF